MPGRRRRTTTTRRRTSTAAGTTTSRKRAPARRTAPSVPELPVAGPGERVWVLAVPFRAPAPGAVWHAGLQAHVFVGRELPAALAPYDPGPYTLERFVEDQLTPEPPPLPSARGMEPRPLQVEGAAAV